MIYGSVCSGIEAASCAWSPLGWKAAFLSEIEPFPRAVLAHHYPETPLHGDFTTIKANDYAAIDLLVGGTPCQSFSVAGLRKGLDDPRGNLMLEFGALAQRLAPRWIVWENVPGVLSSNGGRDFGTFLGMLAELGYGFAYRVLDAQYFGVAQRRRRVFVVGYFGDWRRAAAVLFEQDCMRGNPAPSREAGKDVAGTISARTKGGGGLGSDFEMAGGTVPTLARCDTTGEGKRQDYETCTIIAHSLRGEGFDASEDGTGRGTPLVAVSVSLRGREGGATAELGDEVGNCLRASGGGGDKAHVLAPVVRESLYNKGFTQKESDHASAQETYPGTLLRTLRKEVGEKTFAEWGLGILDSLQQKEVLQQALHGVGVRPAAFSKSWVVDCSLSRPESRGGWLLQSLREAGCERCASQGWEPPEQLSRELGAYLSELSQPGTQAARFVCDLWQASKGAGLLRQALSAVQEVGRSAHGQGQPTHSSMQVRRLTPEECEFLQGFPRGYTNIPLRNAKGNLNGKWSKDGPRYKALGNSMAVPVIAWLGRRIEFVDSIPVAVKVAA